MTAEAGETVFYHAKSRNLKLGLVVFAGFIALGVWIALYGWHAVPRDRVAVWGGATGTAISALFGIANLRLVLSTAPTLALSPHGMHFGDPAAARTIAVPWNEIEGIGLFGVIGQGMIGVDVVDEKAVLRRMGRRMRLLTRMNTMLGYPLLSITTASVSVPLEELAATILDYLERYG